MNIVVGFQYEHRRCGQVRGGEFFDVDPAAKGRSVVAAGTTLATCRTITDQRAIFQTEGHVVGIDAIPFANPPRPELPAPPTALPLTSMRSVLVGVKVEKRRRGFEPAILMPQVNTM